MDKYEQLLQKLIDGQDDIKDSFVHKVKCGEDMHKISQDVASIFAFGKGLATITVIVGVVAGLVKMLS